MAGTNYFTPVTGSSHTNIALTDINDLAMLVSCDTTGETQANVYQIGCLMIRTDNGTTYQNTGTVAVPVWTLNGTGASGTSGFSGANPGASGTSGATGASGTSGTSGFSGKSGFSGTSGTSGFSGTSGTSGFSGTSGTSGTSV